ncbi:FimV/HubP family polar landmark protein [Thiofilum flexile]|uniref:FimV/HubP family polar landmark protein n=1 Tax=Thiofilum flexile TaxID=125627 RepID=UPI00035E7C4E|nr:FimV/HubP family polar landmark protein [Thiofilum flexile]
MTSRTPIKPLTHSLAFLSKVGLLCLAATATAEAKTITIQPNDTLSDIIYTHYPNANNPLEMMRRVHANNPDAFVANNPNRLIVGKPLVLEDTAPLDQEAHTRFELLRTEKQSLSTQLQAIEKENIELKRLLKRFETEQSQYNTTSQPLEGKVTTLDEKVAATSTDSIPTTSTDNELNTQLSNELKKVQADYAALQLQLKAAQELTTEHDQQLSLVKTQLAAQQTTNKELSQALQEARELNGQLTLELQSKQQNSNLPWILGGGAALLLFPLLWWVRRRPVASLSTPDTSSVTATQNPPDTLKVDTNLGEPLYRQGALGFNEGRLKLNIARAYLDKRDTKAAAELLQEVLREGDDTQKQQAREILSFIN